MEMQQPESTPNLFSSSAKQSTPNGLNLTQVQGFWIPTPFLPSIPPFSSKALDDDIIVASKPNLYDMAESTGVYHCEPPSLHTLQHPLELVQPSSTGTVLQIKKMAEFLGCPFSEEEKTGIVNQIADFCSLSNLKDLEVNRYGKIPSSKLPGNKVFFRTGNVGDYVHHLSPAAVERFSNILEEKLSGSGLIFKFS